VTTYTSHLTMADAETRLVEIHGYDRQAARQMLQDARHYGHADTDTFSIDWTGKTRNEANRHGRFVFLED